MSSVQSLQQLYLRTWRGASIALSLSILAYVLYFHRLGSLVPGYSAQELAALHNASDWHHIAANPVNAPYSAVIWLLTAVLHHSILATRVVSACIGTAVALLFFAVVRVWCTYRTAFLVTVVFATSSGLLHFARLGTGDILQMSTLGLIGLTLWYRSERRHRVLIGYLLVLLFVALWYVPGMIWFELLGLIPLRRTIVGQVRRAKIWHLASMFVLCAAAVAPLVAASVRHPHILLHAAGLPESAPDLTHAGTNLWHLMAGISLHSYGSALLWVGHSPLLSTAETVLGLLGAYYVYRIAPGRRLFMFGSGIIGLLLAGAGSASLACLVPILYLFVATGLHYLLQLWLTVFPRNPVARTTGIAIACGMLALSVLYQVRAYFVAWPNAPATRQVFDHRAPKA